MEQGGCRPRKEKASECPGMSPKRVGVALGLLAQKPVLCGKNTVFTSASCLQGDLGAAGPRCKSENPKLALLPQRGPSEQPPRPRVPGRLPQGR